MNFALKIQLQVTKAELIQVKKGENLMLMLSI